MIFLKHLGGVTKRDLLDSDKADEQKNGSGVNKMRQMLKMCAFSHHALVAGDWLALVLCNYVLSFTKKPG